MVALETEGAGVHENRLFPLAAAISAGKFRNESTVHLDPVIVHNMKISPAAPRICNLHRVSRESKTYFVH